MYTYLLCLLLYLRIWSEVRSHQAQVLCWLSSCCLRPHLQILNMADSDSEWWEELLVVDPAVCSAPAPAPDPLLPDPVPVVESRLSVQSVRSMPSAPAPGQILQDPVPIVESLLSVQSVRFMPPA